MRKEFENLLITTFPNTYRGYGVSEGHQFQHDDGWFLLVWNLSLKIETQMLLLSTHERDEWSIHFKEKYGILCVYAGINMYDDKSPYTIQKLIDAAVKLSDRTCEVCGRSGKHRGFDSYEYVACKQHSKPEDLEEDYDD